MGRKALGLPSILIILCFLLAGCGSTSTPIRTPVETDITVNTPIATDSQPTEITSPPLGILEEALDAAYQTMLDDMISYNTVSPDALMELLSEEPLPFLLDVRSQSEVQEMGRIEDSVVIPLRDLAKSESISLLPTFETNIITYCSTGWRCTIAMTILQALGWRDVQTLGEGSFSSWIEADYPIVMDLPANVPLNIAQPDPAIQEWLDELLQKLPEGFGSVTPEVLIRAIADLPDIVLIDVRRSEEVMEREGIENAIHIPIESFILLKEQWPSSKEAKILVYSENGYRSTIAMTILWTYGYVGVASLRGGFNAWIDGGYPTAQIAINE